MKFRYSLLILAVTTSCTAGMHERHPSESLFPDASERRAVCLENPPMETVILPKAVVSRVSGVITHEGNPLEGVSVFLENQETEGWFLMGTTSRDGGFDLNHSEYGHFKLWTCKEGWNSVFIELSITARASPSPLNLELSLSQ